MVTIKNIIGEELGTHEFVGAKAIFNPIKEQVRKQLSAGDLVTVTVGDSEGPLATFTIELS